MSHNLNARYAYANVDDGVAIAGFADDEFQTDQYILLQRSLKVDQDDASLGFDRIYVQLRLRSKETSCYGVIKGVKWDNAAVLLHLDETTALRLGCQVEVDINIEAVPRPSQQFWEAFAVLLQGIPVDDRRINGY